jgi:hypothetical protein
LRRGKARTSAEAAEGNQDNIHNNHSKNNGTLHPSGIEPEPSAWKAEILAIGPWMLLIKFALAFELTNWQCRHNHAVELERQILHAFNLHFGVIHCRLQMIKKLKGK